MLKEEILGMNIFRECFRGPLKTLRRATICPPLAYGIIEITYQLRNILCFVIDWSYGIEVWPLEVEWTHLVVAKEQFNHGCLRKISTGKTLQNGISKPQNCKMKTPCHFYPIFRITFLWRVWAASLHKRDVAANFFKQTYSSEEQKIPPPKKQGVRFYTRAC